MRSRDQEYYNEYMTAMTSTHSCLLAGVRAPSTTHTCKARSTPCFVGMIRVRMRQLLRKVRLCRSLYLRHLRLNLRPCRRHWHHRRRIVDGDSAMWGDLV